MDTETTRTEQERTWDMAQRYEIEAWVNPAAWDDEARALAVVDAIEASGSDDEAEWVRIAGGDTGDVIAAAARDEVKAEHERALTAAGAQRAALLAEVDRATDRLRALTVEACDAGMSEDEAATHAGVTRMTVRSWRGK